MYSVTSRCPYETARIIMYGLKFGDHPVRALTLMHDNNGTEEKGGVHCDKSRE
jgi:hypothetical protein